MPANRADGGKFAKGQSGNPIGRPKVIFKLGEEAQKHAQAALDALVAGLANDDARVQITAAKEILDRGFGKALTVTADVTDRLGEMDDDALDAALDAVRAARSLGSNAGDGKGKATAH